MMLMARFVHLWHTNVSRNLYSTSACVMTELQAWYYCLTYGSHNRENVSDLLARAQIIMPISSVQENNQDDGHITAAFNMGKDDKQGGGLNNNHSGLEPQASSCLQANWPRGSGILSSCEHHLACKSAAIANNQQVQVRDRTTHAVLSPTVHTQIPRSPISVGVARIARDSVQFTTMPVLISPSRPSRAADQI